MEERDEVSRDEADDRKMSLDEADGHTVSEHDRKLKQKIEEEFLVKIGAIEEPFDWHPDILTRRPERPKSSMSLDYPLDLKVGKPKTCNLAINRNPWCCDNQALRQMTLQVSRQGPRVQHLNRPNYGFNRRTNILRLH